MIINESGGGAGLNLKVVGGTTQPTNPKENTVWVSTDAEISGYAFSATEPHRKSKNKNLIVYPFIYTTKTESGVTITDNKDGTLTLNGTCTAAITFRLQGVGVENYEIALEPGTYHLSGGTPESSKSTHYMGLGYSYDNWGTTNWVEDSTGAGVTFTLLHPAKARMNLAISAGVTVSSVVYKPQLEKGSVATSFVKGDAEGMVWFATGLSSSATMNVDKKNTVMLYPLSCKQYISGAWLTKTAKTYQGGAWKEWSLYFYNEGDKCEDVTGGWATAAKGLSADYPDFAAAPSVSYNVGNVKISQQGNKAGLWYTKNKISLTGRKKLTVKTTGYTSTAPNSTIHLLLRTGLSGYVYDEAVASQSIAANGTFSIDLSALSASDTKYHVCIAIYSTCSITVEKLYAE